MSGDDFYQDVKTVTHIRICLSSLALIIFNGNFAVAMDLVNRKARYYLLSFFKHDFKASITVYFVALPLCLGVSLASGAPVYSGLIAGIIGGMVISLFSRSELSVSGPAAGLTAITAAAITALGGIEVFFLSVSIAGILQVLIGVFRLGGFTHFIPSAVIKGMLAAIGILLISKQIPLFIGYDQPDFWTDEFFNILTFDHAFEHIGDIYRHTAAGVITLSTLTLTINYLWRQYMAKRATFVPSAFITVLTGVLLALLFNNYIPALAIDKSQFVSIPKNAFSNIQFPQFDAIFTKVDIWKNAVVICFVASLETLLSITAIDKLDPYNRVTPQNRELIAQGSGNFLCGILGGLPITAVIVRSSANAEAGAKTKLSSITHGIWLLITVLFAASVINLIPYCVLAVILIQTGYNLAKPKMIKAVYRQGREQFMPFIVTVGAILFTDLLIGVLIGIAFAIYFLIKHTYRAGFTVKDHLEGHTKHYSIRLALNVSFLNKKRLIKLLDKIPEYSIVEITGTDSVYIDNDVLEIFHDYKTKAHLKHIQLILKDIPDTETIELH